MIRGGDRATAAPVDAIADRARVTFVISGLVVGGAERVLTALANGWADAGRPVTILALDGPDRPPFFPVDPRVTVRRLGLAGVSRHRLEAVLNNGRRLVRLRQAIAGSRPDVVVSFMDRTNVLALLATVGAPWPVIVSDRTSADPGSGRIWRTLRRISYRRARWVVVQTRGSAAALPSSLRHRAVAIPNPVLDGPGSGRDRADRRAVRPEPGLVVALGRLVPQKGFDLLIDAFPAVIERVPKARLEIWGDGPELDRLRSRIVERRLGSSVTLAGETGDPATAIGRASVFVLSSRVEGFPNVLLEAMAMGRPVVAFDCPFGPAEILTDGVDGRLVPAGDLDGLAGAIADLLASPEGAAALGARAIEVGERFAFGTILARWSDLVDGARDDRRTTSRA